HWPTVRYLTRWLRQNLATASVREIMDSFPVASGTRRGPRSKQQRHLVLTNASVASAADNSSAGAYVSPALIDELGRLEQEKWNVRKLLALLGELNGNHAAGHPYASLMLYRAVIDCVPPLSECKSFAR